MNSLMEALKKLKFSEVEELVKKCNKKTCENKEEDLEKDKEDFFIFTNNPKQKMESAEVDCEDKEKEELNEDQTQEINLDAIAEEPDDEESEDDENNNEEQTTESLNEDITSSMPVELLDPNQVIDFANTVGAGKFFKVGYLKEVAIKSQYRGGRKALVGDPIVRVFKATEYYVCTGTSSTSYRQTKDYLDNGNTLETPRWMSEWITPKRVALTKAGNTAISITPRLESNNHFKVNFKYFISLNDEDLRECTYEEAAQYVAKTVDLDINDYCPDGPRQKYPLLVQNVYYLGNLGRSIM